MWWQITQFDIILYFIVQSHVGADLAHLASQHYRQLEAGSLYLQIIYTDPFWPHDPRHSNYSKQYYHWFSFSLCHTYMLSLSYIYLCKKVTRLYAGKFSADNKNSGQWHSCNTMNFCRRLLVPRKNLTYILDIPFVNNVRYQGVVCERKTTWKMHIQDTSQGCGHIHKDLFPIQKWAVKH